MTTVRRVASAGLTDQELAVLRELFDLCWPDPGDRFTDEDWDHTMGGTHFVIEADGTIVSQAAVVERELHAGDRPLRTGYVEAVATHPGHRRQGYGSAVTDAAGRFIDEGFELGALGSDLFDFYGRLGWTPWRGPTGVRTDAGVEPTPAEDGFILVRKTPSTPELDPTSLLTCEWRPGDAW